MVNIIDICIRRDSDFKDKVMRAEIEQLSKGKRVALFGRGVSTKSVERLLMKNGIGSDYYGEGEKDFGIEEGKSHCLCVYSPSFKRDHKYFGVANESGCECIGEPDFSGRLWKGELVVVSGTNGKTTLTSFLSHALKFAGKESIACGNIGVPLSEFLMESDGRGKVGVCELSSFQGMRLKHVKFDGYGWTNFAEDHLDWHKDMREYFEAKLNIKNFLRKEVFCVGDSVEKYSKIFGIELPSYCRVLGVRGDRVTPKPFDSMIQRENYLIAEMIFEGLGYDKDILRLASDTFELARHRFGKVRVVNGVNFWNDSKATNTHAAIAALKELRGKRVFWIGGGKDKHCDLRELIAEIERSASGAAFIGDTKEKLNDGVGELSIGKYVCDSLEEAVEKGYKEMSGGGEVLFSPAFSSFGMFESYEDRGNKFEEIVKNLR